MSKTAAHYGAYDVRVFGSVARGEAGEASDIDLLVKLEAIDKIERHISPGKLALFTPDGFSRLPNP